MDKQPLDNPLRSALLTDLYELTMAQAYYLENMNRPAVFELYFREMPRNRNFIMAAGLDTVLDYLEHWSFTDSDISYLHKQGQFADTFLNRLKELRFSGDVYAAREGTPVFPYEPIAQVVAPLMEAQIIETLVINQVHFQSLAASKAARVVMAAGGRDVVDFGSRRAHGVDAAIKVGRASYLAGAAGTSNVLAGKMFGVPIFGTMAHSYIQAHDQEYATFEAFARLYPQTTLLVDTYDTIEGVKKVIELNHKLGERFKIRSIRLDSGDLSVLAKQCRKMLDEAGLREVKIFLSSSLDEYRVAALIQDGAPADGFGVGTRMAVSADLTDLDIVYKLVEYDGRPRIKLSENKLIYPGRKQVFRAFNNNIMIRDIIGRYNETLPGHPLLEQVMSGGRRLPAGRISLDQAREHARQELSRLPDFLKSLERYESGYPVAFSELVKQDLESMRKSLSSGRI